jgi:hypothetical protein
MHAIALAQRRSFARSPSINGFSSLFKRFFLRFGPRAIDVRQCIMADYFGPYADRDERVNLERF